MADASFQPLNGTVQLGAMKRPNSLWLPGSTTRHEWLRSLLFLRDNEDPLCGKMTSCSVVPVFQMRRMAWVGTSAQSWSCIRMRLSLVQNSYAMRGDGKILREVAGLVPEILELQAGYEAEHLIAGTILSAIHLHSSMYCAHVHHLDEGYIGAWQPRRPRSFFSMHVAIRESWERAYPVSELYRAYVVLCYLYSLQLTGKALHYFWGQKSLSAELTLKPGPEAMQPSELNAWFSSPTWASSSFKQMPKIKLVVTCLDTSTGHKEVLMLMQLQSWVQQLFSCHCRECFMLRAPLHYPLKLSGLRYVVEKHACITAQAWWALEKNWPAVQYLCQGRSDQSTSSFGWCSRDSLYENVQTFNSNSSTKSTHQQN